MSELRRSSICFSNQSARIRCRDNESQTGQRTSCLVCSYRERLYVLGFFRYLPATKARHFIPQHGQNPVICFENKSISTLYRTNRFVASSMRYILAAGFINGTGQTLLKAFFNDATKGIILLFRFDLFPESRLYC